MTENEIAKQVMDAAFHIHRNIGPGLLETVYEVILTKKLTEMGLAVERQVSVPIRFEGINFDEGFRRAWRPFRGPAARFGNWAIR